MKYLKENEPRKELASAELYQILYLLKNVCPESRNNPLFRGEARLATKITSLFFNDLKSCEDKCHFVEFGAKPGVFAREVYNSDHYYTGISLPEGKWAYEFPDAVSDGQESVIQKFRLFHFNVFEELGRIKSIIEPIIRDGRPVYVICDIGSNAFSDYMNFAVLQELRQYEKDITYSVKFRMPCQNVLPSETVCRPLLSNPLSSESYITNSDDLSDLAVYSQNFAEAYLISLQKYVDFKISKYIENNQMKSSDLIIALARSKVCEDCQTPFTVSDTEGFRSGAIVECECGQHDLLDEIISNVGVGRLNFKYEDFKYFDGSDIPSLNFVHCVGADCTCGAGIAKQLIGSGVPRPQSLPLQVGKAYQVFHNGISYWFLCTKPKSRYRPESSEGLEKALEDLAEQMISIGAFRCDMPFIATGLDHIDRKEVLELIKLKLLKQGISVTIHGKDIEKESHAVQKSRLYTHIRPFLEDKDLKPGRYVYVNSVSGAQAAVNFLLKQKIIGFDLEGILNKTGREKFDLYLFSTPEKLTFIFDNKVPHIFTDGKIKDLLESPVIKVIHGCTQDAIIMKKLRPFKPCNIIDLQQLYMKAFPDECGNKLPGLNKVFDKYKVPENPLKAHIKTLYKKGLDVWGTRPLTKYHLIYATHDVQYIPYCFEKIVDDVSPEDLVSLFYSTCREFSIEEDHNITFPRVNHFVGIDLSPDYKHIPISEETQKLINRFRRKYGFNWNSSEAVWNIPKQTLEKWCDEFDSFFSELDRRPLSQIKTILENDFYYEHIVNALYNDYFLFKMYLNSIELAPKLGYTEDMSGEQGWLKCRAWLKGRITPDLEPEYVPHYDRRISGRFNLPYNGAVEPILPWIPVERNPPLWEKLKSQIENTTGIKQHCIHASDHVSIPTNLRDFLKRLSRKQYSDETLPYEFPAREAEKHRERQKHMPSLFVSAGYDTFGRRDAKQIFERSQKESNKQRQAGSSYPRQPYETFWVEEDKKDSVLVELISEDPVCHKFVCNILEIDENSDIETIVEHIEKSHMFTPSSPNKLKVQGTEYNSPPRTHFLNLAAVCFAVYEFSCTEGQFYKHSRYTPPEFIRLNPHSNPGFPLTEVRCESQNKCFQAYAQYCARQLINTNKDRIEHGMKPFSPLDIFREFQKKEPVPFDKLKVTNRSIQNASCVKMLSDKTLFEDDTNVHRVHKNLSEYLVGFSFAHNGTEQLFSGHHEIWRREGDKLVFNDGVVGHCADYSSWDASMPMCYGVSRALLNYQHKKMGNDDQFHNLDSHCLALYLGCAESSNFSIRRAPDGEIKMHGPGSMPSGECCTTLGNCDNHKLMDNHAIWCDINGGTDVVFDIFPRMAMDLAMKMAGGMRRSFMGDDGCKTLLPTDDGRFFAERHTLRSKSDCWVQQFGTSIKLSVSYEVHTEEEFLKYFSILSHRIIKLPQDTTPWSETRDNLVSAADMKRILGNILVFRKDTLTNRPGDGLARAISHMVEAYPNIMQQYPSVFNIYDHVNREEWDSISHFFDKLINKWLAKCTPADISRCNAHLEKLQISKYNANEPSNFQFVHDVYLDTTRIERRVYYGGYTFSDLSKKYIVLLTSDGLKSAILKHHLESRFPNVNFEFRYDTNFDELNDPENVIYVVSSDLNDPIDQNTKIKDRQVVAPFCKNDRNSLGQLLILSGKQCLSMNNRLLYEQFKMVWRSHKRHCHKKDCVIADIGSGAGLLSFYASNDKETENIRFLNVEPNPHRSRPRGHNLVIEMQTSVKNLADFDKVTHHSKTVFQSPPCFWNFSYSLGHIAEQWNDPHFTVEEALGALPEFFVIDDDLSQPGCYNKGMSSIEVIHPPYISYQIMKQAEIVSDWIKTKPVNFDEFPTDKLNGKIIDKLRWENYAPAIGYWCHQNRTRENLGIQYNLTMVTSLAEQWRLALDDVEKEIATLKKQENVEGLMKVAKRKQEILKDMVEQPNDLISGPLSGNIDQLTSFHVDAMSEHLFFRNEILLKLCDTGICFVQGAAGAGKSAVISYVMKTVLLSLPNSWCVFLSQFNEIVSQFGRTLSALDIPWKGKIFNQDRESATKDTRYEHPVILSTVDSCQRVVEILCARKRTPDKPNVIVVVDEATRLTWQSAALLWAFSRIKWMNICFIFCGDERQLDARAFQSSHSNFFKFYESHFESTVYLTCQWRLGHLSSLLLTYVMQYPPMKVLTNRKDLIIGCKFRQENTGIYEHHKKMVHEIARLGPYLQKNNFIILACYHEQCEQIKRALKARGCEIPVETIDSNMGSTHENVLVCFERANNFCVDPKRLCVGLSRHLKVCVVFYEDNLSRLNTTSNRLLLFLESFYYPLNFAWDNQVFQSNLHHYGKENLLYLHSHIREAHPQDEPGTSSLVIDEVLNAQFG